MKLASGLRPTIVLLAALVLASEVRAQSALCDRYRAELASLDRGTALSRSYEIAAQRQREELARLYAYYRSIGCGSASFFFRPPAACDAMAERLRLLQANASHLAAQAAADPAAIQARRRDLRAAITQSCDGGLGQERATLSGDSRLVCVRACDGYFFPLDSLPRNKASAGALCRALCPNAEVAVFKAPKDGNIEDAVSPEGQPYMKLANALKYQKAYDSSCSCRKPGESWTTALQAAERMLNRKSSDIIVTAEKAEELSRIKTSAPKLLRRTASAPPDKAELQPPTSEALDDPETTGSVAAAPARRPRLIAPELVPVPTAMPDP